MLFQRPSLRTRVTFEAGMTQLGGHAIYLTNDVVMGARESVRDVARNLERFVDAIVARTGPHEVVVELAAQAADPGDQRPDAPRAPAARRSPTCSRSGSASASSGPHRSRSSATATTSTTRSRSSARWGWRSASPIPPEYAPNERIVDRAEELAAAQVGRLVFGRTRRGRPRRGIVYTDAWTSMGQEAETEERRDASPRYQVDDALLEAAGPGRCRDALPARPSRRGDHVLGDGRPA